MNRHLTLSALLISLSVLCGCSDRTLMQNSLVEEAQVSDHTRAGDILEALPAPANKTPVALYEFQDQTGQFKYNDKYTDYSSAVTKGAHAILTKALIDSGHHQWFTVVERGGLKNLIQERQIIKSMRNEYLGPNGTKLPELPSLIYGGMLIEGGIISYDTNVITGGAGATYLGIGASAQYRRDLVTVYLRAVNIQTGEVVLSVTSSKTIFSTSLDSTVLKYITFDKLLQAEAGFSVNEPTQLAVRQAIETAVYSMIMEGALDHLWSFANPADGQRAIDEYLKRRDSKMPVPASKPAFAPSESDKTLPQPGKNAL
jgi:curli production assembly/transport component CsgG